MAVDDRVEIRVNGRRIIVRADLTLAAALLDHGQTAFRRSVGGEPRAPVCGMGICFECCVTVDGIPHRRACLLPVRDGMEVLTGE
jgi:D-hydroxyproline dehydrogenase subunit gamma